MIAQVGLVQYQDPGCAHAEQYLKLQHQPARACGSSNNPMGGYLIPYLAPPSQDALEEMSENIRLNSIVLDNIGLDHSIRLDSIRPDGIGTSIQYKAAYRISGGIGLDSIGLDSIQLDSICPDSVGPDGTKKVDTSIQCKATNLNHPATSAVGPDVAILRLEHLSHPGSQSSGLKSNNFITYRSRPPGSNILYILIFFSSSTQHALRRTCTH
jgi:hypothetical protein